MEQKTKKNITRGMIASGLVAILLSGAGSFINKSNIQSLSSQKARLMSYNNQIYNIALKDPTVYNQNVAKINELEDEIKSYKQSPISFDLFLIGAPMLAAGIYLYPKDKKQKSN